MRRIRHLSMLGLAAGVLTACQPETVLLSEDIPTAGIRFVHAVPDTGAMDLRPVDIVENNHFFGVTFRSTAQLYYRNARAGKRQFRIFMNGTTAAVASTVVKDTTVTLEAGKLYTFMLWGFARPGSTPGMRLTIIEDAAPAPAAGKTALRVVNAGAGLGALDVTAFQDGTTAPTSPTWAGVAELTASAYVIADTSRIRYRVTPSGSATTLFSDALALTGARGGVDFEALPGTQISQSGVSGIVFPRAVAGSQAGTSTTPGIIFVWDRRPPRAPGT